MKPIFFVAGSIFLIIGFDRSVTPILPTTPFVLLAVACFARSSERFHHWIIEQSKLGPPVKAWQARGAIGRRAKIVASVLILINASFPVFIIDGLSYWCERLWAMSIAGLLVFILDTTD